MRRKARDLLIAVLFLGAALWLLFSGFVTGHKPVGPFPILFVDFAVPVACFILIGW